jgi:hypothetical protein
MKIIEKIKKFEIIPCTFNEWVGVTDMKTQIHHGIHCAYYASYIFCFPCLAYNYIKYHLFPELNNNPPVLNNWNGADGNGGNIGNNNVNMENVGNNRRNPVKGGKRKIRKTRKSKKQLRKRKTSRK